jgi:serine/threonine protein kinase
MTLIDTTVKFEERRDISGEGRNSRVFVALDHQLDAEIVVKEIPKSEFLNPNDYFTEARILYASKHPNIMEIQYASQDNDNIYLSMPLMKNGSLNSLINNRFLSVKEIIRYSLDFLSAVHFIHTKGLIHFDIKPTNILINDNGAAVLTDFGLSKYTDQYGLAIPEKIYTPHQVPESILRQDLTVQSDIFQCGMTLYRMCNGNEDFERQLDDVNDIDAEVLNGSFPNRQRYLPHIPKKLRDIINKALSVNENDRYANVLQIMNDLSKIDKNLEWEYNQDKYTGTYVWNTHSDTAVFELKLCEENGVWKTTGKKKMKETSRETRISDWISDYPSQDRALKAVAKIIRDHN